MKELMIALLPALLPVIIQELGQGIRDYLKDERDLRKPCAHGRPGGRLCPKCFKDEEK